MIAQNSTHDLQMHLHVNKLREGWQFAALRIPYKMLIKHSVNRLKGFLFHLRTLFSQVISLTKNFRTNGLTKDSYGHGIRFSSDSSGLHRVRNLNLRCRALLRVDQRLVEAKRGFVHVVRVRREHVHDHREEQRVEQIVQQAELEQVLEVTEKTTGEHVENKVPAEQHPGDRHASRPDREEAGQNEILEEKVHEEGHEDRSAESLERKRRISMNWICLNFNRLKFQFLLIV